MATNYTLSGSNSVLNLDAGAWEDNQAVVAVSSATNGQINVNGGSSSQLDVYGDGNSDVTIKPGSSSLSSLLVTGLGASSHIYAGQGTLYTTGASASNRLIVYADNSSHNINSNAFDIYAQNTQLVMNGASVPQNATIYDYGGNLTWAGTNQTVTTHLQMTNNTAHSLLLGTGTNTFNIQNATNSDGSTQSHLDIVLNIINNANNNYSVNTQDISNASQLLNIFQGEGKLRFQGTNSNIILNGADTANSSTESTSYFYGNDNLFTGNASTTTYLQAGNNSIVKDGSGDVILFGNKTGSGSVYIDSANQDGKGGIYYDAGAENVTVDTHASSYFSALLGSGTATVNFAGLYGFEITMGTGNAVFNNFTMSQGTNPDNDTARGGMKLHLADGQSIVSTQQVGSGTVFHLSTGNDITFTNWQVQSGQNSNPFYGSAQS